MNKQKIMMVVAIATMTFSTGASVLANESETVTGNNLGTEVVDDGLTDVVEPTKPSEEKPVEERTQPSENPVVEPAEPTEDSIVEPTEPKNEPVEQPTKPSEIPELAPTPNEESGKDPVEKPKEDTGVSPGQTSGSTGQKIEDLSVEKPVVTDTGVKIVGTQDAQVIVQREDGSTEVVAAEAIGATVNGDKTVSVKSADGKMKTLPNTGQEKLTSLAMIGSGFAILFGMALRKLKEFMNE